MPRWLRRHADPTPTPLAVVQEPTTTANPAAATTVHLPLGVAAAHRDWVAAQAEADTAKKAPAKAVKKAAKKAAPKKKGS